MGDEWGGPGLRDFATALALALAIEGMAYALFPGAMRRGVEAMAKSPDGALRAGGLLAAGLGVFCVWLARG